MLTVLFPCSLGRGHVAKEMKPSHTSNLKPIVSNPPPLTRQETWEEITLTPKRRLIMDAWGDFSEVKEMKCQSGESVKTDMESEHSYEKQETVQFIDESRGSSAGFRYVDGLSHTDTTSEVGLGDFLKRPVKIATYTWLESDLPIDLWTLNPWHAFFNNIYVKNKVSNFAFVRCNLKVKVVVNASPFYYGSMCCSYQPLPNFTPTTIPGAFSLNKFVNMSQRPHIWILPANSEGGELMLPFFWYKNWLSTQRAQDFTDMGQLTFTAFTDLQSANGVTSAGVTIQVYAWAEDVELSGPSVGLVMQAGDEYGDGIISKPASAIAEAAGKLTKTPVIGRLATATQVGAQALSKISSLFGWSNPPVLESTKPHRSSPFPQMANVELGYPAEKLALDPKNELSVDPSLVGLPKIDELEISYLVQKESYIDVTNWDTTEIPDTILWSSNVTPAMYRTGTENATTFKHYATPMAWVARMFQAWRGDIIFRFKFICTQYHKGRVRISWDPMGTASSNIYNTADTANVVQTVIVDLGNDTDVEFRIPFHQAYPWLILDNAWRTAAVPFSAATTPTWNMDPLYHNGALTVRVQTALTAPVATSNIHMQVFVRGAENLEFANPGMDKKALSIFETQAGEPEENPDQLVAGKIHAVPHERYLVNFGESVKTLRSLLYRYYLSHVSQVNSGNASTMIRQQIFWKYPLHYGYDPNGTHTAKGLITTATSYKFNYTFQNPIDWILGAFIGVKGSMCVTVNPMSIGKINSIRIFRSPEESFSSGTAVNVNHTYATDNATANFAWFYGRGGTGGQALGATQTTQGLSVVIPHFSIAKFQSAHPKWRNAAQTDALTNRDACTLEIMASGSGSATENTDTKIQWYYAGGADLTPLFFLNVPVYHEYRSWPAP